jgi:spoIIIJ-associated protein
MNLYSGKTLEEALDHAADGENVDIEYLQYRVVSQTSDKCEIEAYFVADVIDFVKEYLTTVLTNMGLKTELNGKYEKEVINLNIKTDKDAILIGKGGRTLQALNELVRVAINQRFGKHYKILLDVGDYKEEKYEKLIQMARKYAKEVQTTKTTITLNPMPSDERRIIHGALAGYHNIKTESQGQGKDRRLSIYYVEE